MFGKGIVATVDNFGKMGEQPSNQKLLDYLAVEFQERLGRRLHLEIEPGTYLVARAGALSEQFRLPTKVVNDADMQGCAVAPFRVDSVRRKQRT